MYGKSMIYSTMTSPPFPEVNHTLLFLLTIAGSLNQGAATASCDPNIKVFPAHHCDFLLAAVAVALAALIVL